jgi:hypothetical protein
MREWRYHHHHHWQNSPFWAIIFLRIFCQTASGFHFFWIWQTIHTHTYIYDCNGSCLCNYFLYIVYIAEEGRLPCVQPQTWRTRSLYLCPPSDRVAQLYPRHRVPFPSPSTTRRAKVKVWIGGIAPPFLTSAIDGGEWSPSRPCRFTFGESAPGTHGIEGWVGPRAGLDAVE